MRHYYVMLASDDVEIIWLYPDSDTPTTKVVYTAPPKPVAEARNAKETERSLS